MRISERLPLSRSTSVPPLPLRVTTCSTGPSPTAASAWSSTPASSSANGSTSATRAIAASTATAASASARAGKRRGGGGAAGRFARRSTSSHSAGIVVERGHEGLEGRAQRVSLVHRTASSRSRRRVGARRVQRGPHGSGADLEDGGDRGVVEIGVVVKEQDQAPPLGHQHQRGAHPLGRRVAVAVGSRPRFVGEGGRGPRTTVLVMGRVDDDAPQPGFERPLAAEARPLAHGQSECVLHRVARQIAVPGDGGRHAAELRQPRAVDPLDRVEAGSLWVLPRCHVPVRRRPWGKFFIAPRLTIPLMADQARGPDPRTAPPAPRGPGKRPWRVSPAPDGRGAPAERQPMLPFSWRRFVTILAVLFLVNWLLVQVFAPAEGSGSGCPTPRTSSPR